MANEHKHLGPLKRLVTPTLKRPHKRTQKNPKHWYTHSTQEWSKMWCVYYLLHILSYTAHIQYEHLLMEAIKDKTVIYLWEEVICRNAFKRHHFLIYICIHWNNGFINVSQNATLCLNMLGRINEFLRAWIEEAAPTPLPLYLVDWIGRRADECVCVYVCVQEGGYGWPSMTMGWPWSSFSSCGFPKITQWCRSCHLQAP